MFTVMYSEVLNYELRGDPMTFCFVLFIDLKYKYNTF